MEYLVQVSIADASGSNNATTIVQVASAGVQLGVVGGTGARELGSLSVITLDATPTVDLDRINDDPFAFTWTCEALGDDDS